jgi:hypothetical protein
MEQISGAQLPYSLKFSADSGQILSLVAQNSGTSGSLKCQIFVNGVEKETATSEGAYVVVTCSGMV